MIKPIELTEQVKSKGLDSLYLKECSNIEAKIDDCILNGFLLGISVFNTSVHDTEKLHPNSFIDTIKRYKDAGWEIKHYKPWSALFVSIEIENPKKSNQ